MIRGHGINKQWPLVQCRVTSQWLYVQFVLFGEENTGWIICSLTPSHSRMNSSSCWGKHRGGWRAVKSRQNSVAVLTDGDWLATLEPHEGFVLGHEVIKGNYCMYMTVGMIYSHCHTVIFSRVGRRPAALHWPFSLGLGSIEGWHHWQEVSYRSSRPMGGWWNRIHSQLPSDLFARNSFLYKPIRASCDWSDLMICCRLDQVLLLLHSLTTLLHLS